MLRDLERWSNTIGDPSVSFIWKKVVWAKRLLEKCVKMLLDNLD
jgi:hypothetical protein